MTLNSEALTTSMRKIQDMYIIEDVMDESYVNTLYKFITESKNFQYVMNTSYTDNVKIDIKDEKNLIEDFGQMVFVISDLMNVYSIEARNHLNPLFSKLHNVIPEIPIHVIHRVKANILFNQPSNSKEKINTPHIDSYSGYAGLYYLHDSDGDTVFFDQYLSGVDETMNTSKINFRFTPKKNTLILFPANRVHASSNPINTKARFVINFNLI